MKHRMRGRESYKSETFKHKSKLIARGQKIKKIHEYMNIRFTLETRE